MSDDSDLDQYSDDISDEEDEEEEEQPQRKRRKVDLVSTLFDDEVEEVDEESEGEMEEGYEPHQQQDRYQFPERKRNMSQYDEDQLRRIADKFEEQEERYEDREEYDEEPVNLVNRRQLLPTIHDPRLFLVKCKPGDERKIVYILLQKCSERKKSRNPLQIKSAIYTEHTKGYFHVEAKSIAQVKQALALITFTNFKDPVPVNTKDMPDVLKIPRKAISLNKGSWVRIRRGVYKGDLAEVYRVEDQKVWVRLVPRLDLTTGEDEQTSGKRKRKQRMPARLFNFEEVRAVIGKDNEILLQSNVRDNATAEYFDMYKKDKFKDGFLYKAINIKSLDTFGITPTIEETKPFQDQTQDEYGNEESAIASISAVASRSRPKRKIQFAKGDTIQVVEGPLKNLLGTVDSVQDEIVTFMPHLEQFSSLLKLEASKVRKYFKEGDHVRVTDGRYKGDTGLIVHVDGDLVVVFSDLGNNEFKVHIRDVQECPNVSTGKTQLGNYQLHDLVTLGQTVGVIVKVERDSFLILDTTDTVKQVRLQEMGPKRYSSATLDKYGNQIVAGDIVKIIEGKNKNREGTVKYVFKHHIFIHSSTSIENSGICVARGNSTIQVGGKKGADLGVGAHGGNFPPRDRDGFGGRGRGRGGDRGGPPGAGRGRGRGSRQDKYSLKPMRIIRGPYKGQMGLIRDISDTVYRLELLSKDKIVTVSIADTKEVDATAENNLARSSGRTPMLGDRTPMYGDRTPMYGDRTPMHGDRTPMYGDRTPMHGDRTPMHGDISRGDRTPSRGDRTPSRGNETPGHDEWAQNPSTPAPDSYNSYTDDYHKSMTPNYPLYSPFGQVGTPGTDMHYPSTPKVFSIDTPKAYSVETPYSISESPYYSSTPQSYPQTPATPGMGVPQTPGMGDAYNDYDSHSYNDNDHHYLASEIEARVSDDYSDGHFRGETVVITEVAKDHSRVKILSSGSNTFVPNRYLQPVMAKKDNRVKVIHGEHKGAYGVLRSINESNDRNQASGVVYLDSDDLIISDMNQIGKLNNN